MENDGGLRLRLPAGLIDSGFASLATFVVALTAVSQFDAVDRGVYAVFFTAFLAGALLSNELIFTPAEVAAVALPVPERLSFLPQSLKLGLVPSVLGALAAPIAVIVTASYASTEVAVALATTSAVAIVLSPMQDHTRRMFHISFQSWHAAWVSVVQFVVASLAVAGGLLFEVPLAWIPFGALALANAASLSFAVVIASHGMDARSSASLRFAPLARKGVWFVLNAAGPAISGFAVAAIVAWLASPEDLGYAESARVVAQPILVFAGGMSAVLAPRAMRAAMDNDRAAARSMSRIYLVGTSLAAVAYLAIVGWNWTLNPMGVIVPSAYVVTGLVALTVVSNTAMAATFLQSAELAGAHREKTLAAISWATGVLWVLGGMTAGVTGAYARPLGALASGFARYGSQSVALSGVYRSGVQSTPEDAMPAAAVFGEESTTIIEDSSTER